MTATTSPSTPTSAASAPTGAPGAFASAILGSSGPDDDDDAVAAAKPRRNMADLAGPIGGFIAFIGFWYFMSYWGLKHLFNKPAFLLPPVHRVLNVSIGNHFVRKQLFDATILSARVALAGLLISILLGVGLAVVMSRTRWIERMAWPYLVALQAIPILAFVPLLGVLFGFNFKARVIVCVMISIFPIVSNTLFGLLSADRGQHDLFTLRGASRWTRLRKLQFPAALPAIFAGFRISAGLSVIGAVVGDTFFRQGQPGVGILIDNYRSRLNNPAMYGAVILAAFLGIAVFALFGWLSEKAVGHWYESTR